MSNSSGVSIAGATPPFILAIDIGSSSIRCILFDVHGRSLNGTSVSLPITPDVQADGAVTFLADELVENICQCIDGCLIKAGALTREVVAVACDSFVTSLLGLDDQDKPVTPLSTYADTRSTPDALHLKLLLDEAATHQRTGCPFHPTYQAPRFLWMQRQHPEWLATCRRWLTIGEYLALKLFGETAITYSAASFGGMLNRWLMAWDEELLAALPLRRECLSGLVDANQPFQGLRPPYANRWPVLKNLPWFPVIADGAGANVGSGCTSPRYIAITMGTSAAIRITIPGRLERIPGELWCYFIDREHTLLGGALIEGGNLLAWMKSTLQLPAGEDIEALVASVPPGAHGLTFLPLLAGERSPGWKAEARGSLTGINFATTPSDILRAGYEGLAYRISSIVELLEPYLEGQPTIIASGGVLTHSPAMLQILTDVLGRPLYLSNVPEPSARGAAILALRSLGIAQDLDSFDAMIGNEVQPDPTKHDAYSEMINRQRKIYRSL